MKHFQIFATVLLAALLASCHPGSDTSLNSATWVIPSIGTMYIYQVTPADSNTNNFDTLTILSTGQQIGGKTNVTRYIARSNGGNNILYFNIESNNDFSFASEQYYDSVGNPLKTPTYSWETYPTGSRRTIFTGPQADSFASDGEHIVDSNICTFVGNENLSTSAGAYSTLHVRESYVDIDSIPIDSLGFSSSKVDVTDLWFDPSLGLYVKFIENDTTDGQGSKLEFVLTKYLPQ